MQSGIGRVLVLERALEAGISIETMLVSGGYEARGAEDALTALRMLDEWKPAAIVVDLRAPERQGYQSLAALANRLRSDDVPLVLVGETPNLLKKLAPVPSALVPTPVDRELLVSAVARVSRRMAVAT